MLIQEFHYRSNVDSVSGGAAVVFARSRFLIYKYFPDIYSFIQPFIHSSVRPLPAAPTNALDDHICMRVCMCLLMFLLQLLPTIWVFLVLWHLFIVYFLGILGILVNSEVYLPGRLVAVVFGFGFGFSFLASKQQVSYITYQFFLPSVIYCRWNFYRVFLLSNYKQRYILLYNYHLVFLFCLIIQVCMGGKSL